MPIAMIGIFNKRCSQNFYDALYYLALMRPNLVIPLTLEKVYPSWDCDIEPHKLNTAMTCMIAISRPLVQGPRIPYKGKTIFLISFYLKYFSGNLNLV